MARIVRFPVPQPISRTRWPSASSACPIRLLVDAVEAEQAGQQVVAGQQRVVAGSGKVVMWRWF